MNFTRSQWKKMRAGISNGLPPGEKTRCKECGKLIILEINSKEFIVHHEMPHCNEFEKVANSAEFLTLSKAEIAEVKLAQAVRWCLDCKGKNPWELGDSWTCIHCGAVWKRPDKES